MLPYVSSFSPDQRSLKQEQKQLHASHFLASGWSLEKLPNKWDLDVENVTRLQELRHKYKFSSVPCHKNRKNNSEAEKIHQGMEERERQRGGQLEVRTLKGDSEDEGRHKDFAN